MIKVEGHKNLYRDERSGAIINCDDVAYDNYVRSVKASEKKKNEIDQMKNVYHSSSDQFHFSSFQMSLKYECSYRMQHHHN